MTNQGDNLVFYDSEGNYLNFNYNSILSRYEGDILFPVNSNDTFKNQTLYMFEKIGAFQYQDSNLTLQKWQLFNEFGFNFYAAGSTFEVIRLIEPVNNKSNYYSKWVYGQNFHKKFPLGSIIRFDNSIFEFISTSKVYVVVSNKKDAIMILSFTDNNTFSSIYPYLTYSYGSNTISSVNIIGVHNYVDSSLSDTLSTWNEQNFYENIFYGQKLSIVNTYHNDKYSQTGNYIDAFPVTVINPSLSDLNYYEYSTSTLPTNSDISIEVILRTDLPLIYTGPLTFYDNVTQLNIGGNLYSNVLGFGLNMPIILQPGVSFEVSNSTLNPVFFQISNIPTFVGNVSLVSYSLGNQVLWNNRIFQCVQSYTWSATSSINPDNADYWGLPTYLPLTNAPAYESLVGGDLYLISDHLYFTQSFTQSSLVTLASIAQKYTDELKILNINLYYNEESLTLYANLIYPSQYAIVNFYGITSSSLTSSVVLGGQDLIYERAIEVYEDIKWEFNSNFSSNFSYNIVFTHLDEYGLLLKINQDVYQQEIDVIGTMDQTIDQTLRNWMIDNSEKLLTLGIIPTLQTIGTSSYFNSINLSTQFPNVPLEFTVQVGSTADYYISSKRLYFYNPSIEGVVGSLGSFINITVNGISYGVTNSVTTPIGDTIQNWVGQYYDILESYNIIALGLTSSIVFGVLDPAQNCVIGVNAGRSSLPGDYNYSVVDLMPGNLGSMLTSNQILLGTWSGNGFEDSGFSTGMVTGVNNTIYPIQDVEYNVLFLSSNTICLSYEGPFWGITSSLCLTSPFKIVAFNLFGFTQSDCGTVSGGMFDYQQFNSSFSNATGSNTLGSQTYSNIPQNGYGILDPNYVHPDSLWLHTKDYIRRPRANYSNDPQVSLYWKWFSNNVPEFFLYDISGDLLPTTGSLAYVGAKPLPSVYLNRNANRNLDWVSLPQYQQTIFPIIPYQLSYIDDAFDTSAVPEPIETFIGFNSQVEGGLRSILQLYYQVNIDFTINTFTDQSDVITLQSVYDATTGATYGVITLDVNSTSNFLTDEFGNPRGLEPGLQLAIFISDETNQQNQYLSPNSGYLVQITGVYFKSITVNFFKSVDSLFSESSIVSDYPAVGSKTYLSVRFKVWDKELGRFNVYGQTEIEDIRYEIELGNVGKLVSSDDVYIFKEYDIKEEGIDWVYLNKKRKEMLMMKNLIYPYIGSYKAIINAINYFGYNDLQLYEYYKNINTLSTNYGTLHKVEIPNIFDNTVTGWTDNDFLKDTFPNSNYEDTKLFNLTYLITDKQGNNLLSYSLQEVQTKLNGLKHWLEKNIIPISHTILDITGKADFVPQMTISHITRDLKIFRVYENFTPVSFKLNELYLMPVNSGSTVYNCVLDFYSPTQSNSPYPGILGCDMPDSYSVDIRTYQIWREWYAFTNYMIGDRVIYYNKLYESVVDNNVTNNPRKYENVKSWSSGAIYNVSDIVAYNREYYVYSAYGITFSTATFSIDSVSVGDVISISTWTSSVICSAVSSTSSTSGFASIVASSFNNGYTASSFNNVVTIIAPQILNGTILSVTSVGSVSSSSLVLSDIIPSIVSPYSDTNNWLNITRTSSYGWKEIDLSPIQHITERRVGGNLLPYNFTIDSNIDPYLVIEVTSDNGYGAYYTDRKNYDISGILQLKELESYTNMTSKQYTDSVIGIVYP